MAKYNTDWSGIPDTCTTATVQKTQRVNGARVVHLAKAGIRGAEVSGTFKLAEGAEMKTLWGSGASWSSAYGLVVSPRPRGCISRY